MDISTTTAPRSDQQNFDDYLSGPKTVTITEVRAGTDEQPVELHLAEFPGRPYKPSKTMRRVLVAAWGAETDVYAGRQMTLYGDPTVKFGGVACGGIKISHLSNIDKPLKLSLTSTRGKREPHEVKLLADDAPVRVSDLSTALAGIEVATTVEQCRSVWDTHAGSLNAADKSKLRDAMVAAKARIEGGAS